MADPTRYSPSYSFSGWQTANPGKPLPATRLDNELFNIATALGGGVNAIKDIRRSDGKLKNGIVDLAALSDEVISNLGGGTGPGLIFASRGQAEDGTSNAVVMSPLRVSQAIAALGGSGGGGGGIPAWTDITGKPTTIDGFGIADAYTKSQTNAQIDAAVAAGGGGTGEGTDTPSQLLDKLKTVDGPSSGLDADTLDGFHAADLLQPLYSVKRFGAVGDGTTDDTVAFKAALAAAIANRTGIYVPTGTYIISTSLTGTLSATRSDSLTVRGDGQGVSLLKFTGGVDAGFVITLRQFRQSVHFRDLGFHTTAKNIGEAIKVTQLDPLREFENSSFRDCTFRGAEGLTACWNMGVHFINVSGSGWDNCSFYGNGGGANNGTGIRFEGTSTTVEGFNYSIYHNISKCIFNGLSYGVIYGSAAQGVTISQSNFQNGEIGIWIRPNGVGQAQINVNDSQFATYGTCILHEAACSPFTYRGNCILPMTGADGIICTNGRLGTIIGNQIAYIGTDGFTRRGISVAGSDNVVTGNTLSGFLYGVELKGTNNRAENNVFSYMVNQYLDAGVANFIPGYGARFQRNSSVTLTANTLNIIQFDGLFQVTGQPGENMSDGAWVCNADGLYCFTAGLELDNTTFGVVIMNFQKNATSGAAITAVSSMTTQQGAQVIQCTTGPIPLKTADVIRVGCSPDKARILKGGVPGTFFDVRRLT